MSRFRKKRNRPNVWHESQSINNNVNENFETFYRATLPWAEAQHCSWDDFLSSLRLPLPTSFRLSNHSASHRERVEQLVKEIRLCLEQNKSAPEPDDSAEESNTSCAHVAIRELAFLHCDRNMVSPTAWDISIPRRALRKDSKLSIYHQHLVAETEAGILSRQEAVSMLPVHYLDIQKGHKILDMCAAPGSKTCQILERMDELETDETGGFLIANDVDPKRLAVLIRQCARLCEANARLVVTNHCATRFPLITQFDRILCDVMCSGDGTLRKSPDIWQRWSPMDGAHMHRSQTRVLHRGLQLLRPGGILVYSTCSMNPLENEAVVLNSLMQWKGAVKILDVRHVLPQLRWVPGLCSWKVMDPSGVLYEQFEEMPEEVRTRYHIRSTMFPPTNCDPKEFGIENTLRILPHLQNTGGFYVAVLQKQEDLTACSTNAASHPRDSQGTEACTPLPLGQRPFLDTSFSDTGKKKIFRRFIPMGQNYQEQVLKAIDFKESFRWENVAVATDADKNPKAYFVSCDVQDILSSAYHVLHVGQKIFELRSGVISSVKLAREAVNFLSAHVIQELLFHVSASTLLGLLETDSKKTSDVIMDILGNNHSIYSRRGHHIILECNVADESIVLHALLRWNTYQSEWSIDADPLYKLWMTRLLYACKRTPSA